MDRREYRLRHFPALLARWRGSWAHMHELTCSHQSLLIHLTQPDSRNYLEIACIAPETINGVVVWPDSDITVQICDTEGFLVEDKGAGVSIRTASVEISEGIY